MCDYRTVSACRCMILIVCLHCPRRGAAGTCIEQGNLQEALDQLRFRGRFRAMSIECCPIAVKLGPASANFERFRPKLGRNRLNRGAVYPSFGHFVPGLGSTWALLAELSPVSARGWPTSTTFWRYRTNFARVWPFFCLATLDESSRIWSDFCQHRPGADQMLANSADCCAGWPKLHATSTRDLTT